MSNEISQEELRQQFEDENGLICSTLWERLSNTPYQVQLEAGEPPKQMALGDIEGLQRYISNTFAGVSAIVGEDEMRGFDYESRYGMAHYLLERFMANLGAAPLDPAHMAQLEQIDLASYLHTPNTKSLVQKMHDTAHILFEPPIDTLTEDNLIGAVYKRGVALLEAYQGYAERKAIDMEPPLSAEYYETVTKMMYEVAEAAAGEHSDLEPNDLMRAMWHLVEDAFAGQENFPAQTFEHNCNVKSDYFQSMLDDARTLNPYAIDRNHVISAAKQHLDEENMELMQASYRLISEVPFRVQNQETDEIEDKALSAVPELSPTLNNFNMAMHHMLTHDCAGMLASPKAKLVTHYTDQFLDDVRHAMEDDSIDTRAIKNMNDTPYKPADFGAYKAIFSALFGEMEIHGDIEKNSKNQQLMLRCGEALTVIAKHGEGCNVLASIEPQHLKFLNDILAQLGEALDTDDVFDDVELGPIMTTVWDLMEEAMYSEQEPAEFYDTHNMQSDWMQEQLGAAIERSEQMQEDRDAENDVEVPTLATGTHLGYRLKRSAIPENELRKIAWDTTNKANISDALRAEGRQKLKDEGLQPAILGYKREVLQSTFWSISEDNVKHEIVPDAIMKEDFDRIYAKMQDALLTRNADLSKTNAALDITNAYVNIFMQNNFRRICDMHKSDDVPEAYSRAINRALTGSPSQLEELVDAAYRIGTLRFGPVPHINQDDKGKVTRYNITSNRTEGMEEVSEAHGILSDAASRYGRMGSVMQAIEENVELMFSLLSYAKDPKAEMEAKMPILRDLAERLDNPPEPYQDMTAGAAVEIMINAFGDATDPEISADAMRHDYDFSNTVYFDARMKSNPDLKTRMIQNNGRITPQKGAPYVQ